MEYPNATITVAGDDLLGATSGTQNGPVIDRAIISSQLPNSNTQLANLKLSDIPNATVYKIDTVKHQGNTSQPEITLHNDSFNDNYTINTIGLLGHANGESPNNDILFIVATASDDPFIMPKHSETKFDLSIALPFAFGPTDNVTIKTTEAGMVSEGEFNSYANSETGNVSSLSASVGGYDFNRHAYSGALGAFAQSVKDRLNAAGNTSEINDIKSDVATDNSEYQSLSGSTDSNYQSVSNAINNVAQSTVNNSTITDLSNSVSTNSSAIANLSSNDINNGQSISNLYGSVSANSTAISNMANSTVNNQTIVNLTNSVSANSNAIANLPQIPQNISNIATDEESISNNAKSISDLSNQNQSLASTANTARDQLGRNVINDSSVESAYDKEIPAQSGEICEVTASAPKYSELTVSSINNPNNSLDFKGTQGNETKEFTIGSADLNNMHGDTGTLSLEVNNNVDDASTTVSVSVNLYKPSVLLDKINNGNKISIIHPAKNGNNFDFNCLNFGKNIYVNNGEDPIYLIAAEYNGNPITFDNFDKTEVNLSSSDDSNYINANVMIINKFNNIIFGIIEASIGAYDMGNQEGTLTIYEIDNNIHIHFNHFI